MNIITRNHASMKNGTYTCVCVCVCACVCVNVKCKCNSIFTCNVSFLNLMYGWYSLVVTQPSTSHQLVCVHCFVRYLL